VSEHETSPRTPSPVPSAPVHWWVKVCRWLWRVLRMAILSSFLTYAKKLKFLDENPIDLLEREKVQDLLARKHST
jgi:hypothetical protein